MSLKCKKCGEESLRSTGGITSPGFEMGVRSLVTIADSFSGISIGEQYYCTLCGRTYVECGNCEKLSRMKNRLAKLNVFECKHCGKKNRLTH